MALKKKFLELENRFRNASFQKSSEIEVFLQQINEVLNAIEIPYKDLQIAKPIILVIGIPRSGSTLLSQLISTFFDVGTINNLIARFWKVPVVGIRLSKILLEKERLTSNFNSSYGVTQSIEEPHEFGYFWLSQLKYKDLRIGASYFNLATAKSLRICLANMVAEYNKPIIFKNLLPAFHLSLLYPEIPQLKIIQIKRNKIQTGISILKARRARYGSDEVWWSIKPANYEELVHKSPIFQIASQIVATEKAIENEIQQCEGINSIEIEYEKLCHAPMVEMERLSNFLEMRVENKKRINVENIKLSYYDDEMIIKQFNQAFSQLEEF